MWHLKKFITEAQLNWKKDTCSNACNNTAVLYIPIQLNVACTHHAQHSSLHVCLSVCLWRLGLIALWTEPHHQPLGTPLTPAGGPRRFYRKVARSARRRLWSSRASPPLRASLVPSHVPTRQQSPPPPHTHTPFQHTPLINGSPVGSQIREREHPLLLPATGRTHTARILWMAYLPMYA